MEIKEIKKLEKNFEKYFCESCDFKCRQKCDWERHILRPKHINNLNWKQMEIEKLNKRANSQVVTGKFIDEVCTAKEGNLLHL